MRSPRLAAKAAALLLTGACLSACGAGGEEADGREADPMVQRALNDPLMADPDLVSQNMANAALKFEIGHPLPPEDTGQSAVIAAREAALEMLGGSTGLKSLPDAKDGAALSDAEALNTIGRIGRLPLAENCKHALRLSPLWAARLPTALQPYPRGSVKEAVGADGPGCHARAVAYLTPVPLDDVLAFHHSRAVQAGFAAEYRITGDWHVLGGRRGTSRFEVTARTLPSGLAEVAIATLDEG